MEHFLTIVIPVYNAASYLEHCLSGIIPLIDGTIENYNIQIILIDDGSTDKSFELCEDYANKYTFITALTQENAGPSVCRNKGIDLSDSKYIAFFDSDDYIDTNNFLKHLSLLDKYDFDIWCSDFERVSDNGAILDKVYQIENTVNPIKNDSYMKKFLSKKECFWNVWRYIFRREFLIENDFRCVEGIHCAEDLEFMVKTLVATDKVCFFHKPYYKYRVNYGDTLTRRYTTERVEHLIQMLSLSFEHLNQNEKNYTQLVKNKLVREYIYNLSLVHQMETGSKEISKKIFYTKCNMLKESDNPIDKIFSLYMQVIGIEHASKQLFLLKKIKQFMRKISNHKLSHGKNRSYFNYD